jgi:uncharacterized membrane protein (DUF2068 family)
VQEVRIGRDGSAYDQTDVRKFRETGAFDSMMGSERKVRIIAGYELFKGLLLLVLACGTLGFVHKDVQEIVAGWIRALHFDPEGHHIGALLAKIGLLNDKRIEELSAITFFYSVLHLIEGVGLWLNKRWGKFFTIIVTGSFIPLEIYAMYEHFRIVKLVVFAANIVIIWYLIAMVRREKYSAYYYRPTVLFQ